MSYRDQDRGRDQRGRNQQGRNQQGRDNRGSDNRGRGGQRDDRGGSFDAGTGVEPLEVKSGLLMVVDQFMLSNPQMMQIIEQQIGRDLQAPAPGMFFDEETVARLELARAPLQRYGGALLHMTPGMYEVQRDPHLSVMAIVPYSGGNEGGAKSYLLESVVELKHQLSPFGRVHIDTRCVVFADVSLLLNYDVLARYAELRERGDDKGGRDLLRSQGAAVRYGFAKSGDDLGVFHAKEFGAIALWPLSEKPTEKTVADESESEDIGNVA